MTSEIHYVTTHRDGDDCLREPRATWECSCGRGGSADEYKVDQASNRHITEQGGQRVDRYPAR
jgi:hypothetical protein